MLSKHFIFDGKTSDEMSLFNVHVNNMGVIEVPYFGGAEIQEDYKKGKLTPYFYGVSRKCIEFDVQFQLMSGGDRKEWTPQQRYEIAKWLVHDTYKEFQTSDDLGKRYYVICVNPGNLKLKNSKGYVELRFRTNSPFAWTSPVIQYEDLSDNLTTRMIQVENLSNVSRLYRPSVEIQLVNGETGVQLKNLSNGGEIFEFEGLDPDELVSIDNENEVVLSGSFGNNAFSKFNRGWLELVPGINQIEVTGQCQLWLKSQFPIAQ